MKVKLLDRPVDNAGLTYGHKLWVVTEEIGVQIAVLVSFSWEVTGVSRRHRVRSLIIQEALRPQADPRHDSWEMKCLVCLRKASESSWKTWGRHQGRGRSEHLYLVCSHHKNSSIVRVFKHIVICRYMQMLYYCSVSCLFVISKRWYDSFFSPTGTTGVISPASFCSFGNDQRHDKCRGRTPPASVSQNLHPPLRECQVRVQQQNTCVCPE